MNYLPIFEFVYNQTRGELTSLKFRVEVGCRVLNPRHDFDQFFDETRDDAFEYGRATSRGT